MPKNSAIKIPFQTNRLHSALTASASLPALKVALRESHCSSSHRPGNNRRDSAANEVIDSELPLSPIGTPRQSNSAMSAFGGKADIDWKRSDVRF
jgi:hypothetical protein